MLNDLFFLVPDTTGIGIFCHELRGHANAGLVGQILGIPDTISGVGDLG